MGNTLVENHPKYDRGFGPFYNKLFQYINPTTLIEIGVGIGVCPIAWANTFPDATIVGIERGSPVYSHCFDQDLTFRQNYYTQQCMEEISRLPMREQNRIHIHFNRDGYSKEVADEALDAYGQLPFIIDDGKQNGLVHKEFLANWKQNITPDGLLIRERAFRYPGFPGMRMNQTRKALHNGWVLVDCRAFIADPQQGEPPNQQGMIAFWTQEKELWISRFKDDFDLYTDQEYDKLLETGCLLEEDPCH